MIRSLAAAELEGFISRYYAFLGHSNPRGFARQAVAAMRDPHGDAARSFILFAEAGLPLAGAHVVAPQPSDDDQNLYLSNLWFISPNDLQRLLSELLRKHPHEAAHCPLYNFSPEQLERIAPVLTSLGFGLRQAHALTFALADLPSVGLPVALEAWSEENDVLFRTVFARAEGFTPSDRWWAWLKRWRGPLIPDLWLLGRETPDQEPIGYAFYGIRRNGVDGEYYLTASGVLAKYRRSSALLRRLLLSSLPELAARSPMGTVTTLITQPDPKLIRILESLGFETQERYPLFIKLPG
ncbi:MAG: hypothetical protein KGZ60_01415 [Truepera sp.]|nr:hypothetical protein [Truepera sp.]